MAKWTLLLLFLLIAPSALAQNPGPPPSGPPQGMRSQRGQEAPSLPDEMRTRMEIARADSDHKKMLDSAKELGDLSAEIEKKYQETSALTTDEYKKLASIEKLAKKILSESGGSKVDGKDDELHGVTLGDAITRLRKAAVNVEHRVVTETRFVVSASVIAGSNEVIHLAQYIRHTQKSD